MLLIVIRERRCVLQGPSTEMRRSVLDLLDLTISFTYINKPGLLSTYLTFSKVGMVFLLH